MGTVTLNIKNITNNQTFCAGVVLTRESCVLVTLNMDGLPRGMEHSAWRVGGVGGGQKPGETVWDCALSEAKEEICTEVCGSIHEVSKSHWSVGGVTKEELEE